MDFICIYNIQKKVVVRCRCALKNNNDHLLMEVVVGVLRFAIAYHYQNNIQEPQHNNSSQTLQGSFNKADWLMEVTACGVQELPNPASMQPGRCFSLEADK